MAKHHKPQPKTHMLYKIYALYFLGAFWGLASFFLLAGIYFTFEKSLIFWLFALSIFLPGTIAVSTQYSEFAGTTILLAALYGVVLLSLLVVVFKPGKKPLKRARLKKRA